MNNIVPSVILLMGEFLAIIRNYNHIGLFFANQHFSDANEIPNLFFCQFLLNNLSV